MGRLVRLEKETRTGRLNRLALGTAQFGLDYGVANRRGQIPRSEAREILDLAAARGIDTLDTATAYGDSEQRLGAIGVQKWQIVSKLPPLPDGCQNIPRWVSDSVRGSLNRLNVESLHGVLFHRPQQLSGKAGDALYASLERQKRDGLVGKIGVSIYEPTELEALNDYGLDIVQAPLNVVDRRLIDSGWLSRLSKQGTEVHVRSVFLQGLLLMPPTDRPERFSRWGELWSFWEHWLSETGLSPLEACLRYSLSFDQVDRVIVGVDGIRQLEEVVMASEGPPPEVPPALMSRDIDLIDPSRWRLP